MNYGGVDASNSKPSVQWGKWQIQFLWLPKRIDGRWHWLRKIHYRWRYTGNTEYIAEFQYAIDVFDLIEKDSL